MKTWGLGLVALYGIVGALAGWAGVAILVAVSTAGVALMLGADALHDWRSRR